MSEQQRYPAEARALFRYGVIAEAINLRLSPAERGRTARELAGRNWVTPEGTERSYSRTTIDRWLAAYAKDGLAGLRRLPRTDRAAPAPGRLAGRGGQAAKSGARPLVGQIVDIIARAHGVFLSERTVREHLRRAGLPARRCPWHRAGIRPFRGRPSQRDPGRRRAGRALRARPRVPGSKRAKRSCS